MLKGNINHAGKLIEVEIEIRDGEIVIYFPSGIDTANWYHAVTIKRLSE